MKLIRSQWTEANAKLGRCRRCMQLSLLGAVGGWAALAATYLAGAPTILAIGLAVLAGAFTALLAAHIVAFFVRPTPAGEPCGGCGKTLSAPSLDAGPASSREVSRRAFVTGAAGAIAAVVALFAGRASPGSAAGKCKPNFRVGQIVQQGRAGCTFAYGVDHDCACHGTCDKIEGQRPPCERNGTLTYAWTLAVTAGTAVINGAANAQNVVIDVTAPGATYNLTVTVGGCECCCRGANPADCQAAAAKTSGPKTFKVAC